MDRYLICAAYKYVAEHYYYNQWSKGYEKLSQVQRVGYKDWVFGDFWLPAHKITIECDGEKHKLDVLYDRRRALWLARIHGGATVRFWNRDILSGEAEAHLRQMLGVT